MPINEKCCTHPLIASDADPSHPKATVDDLMSLVWIADASLASHTQLTAHEGTRQCVADTCAQFQKWMNCLQPATCKSATQVFNQTTLPTNALHIQKQTEPSLWTNAFLATHAMSACATPDKQSRGCHLSSQQPPFLMTVQHASEPSRPRRNNNAPWPAESLPLPNPSFTMPRKPCFHARDCPLIFVLSCALFQL